jgi:RND family efflux transporter MFP subunit
VSRNQDLLQIDQRDYEFARDETSGALGELRSEINSTQALLRIAEDQLDIEKRDHARETRLRGVVSDADVDQAERELLAAENAVANLQSQLSNLTSREARLDAAFRRAKLNLERTTVKAPIAGVIVEDLVEEDAFVQPGATLVTIEDTSKAEITCNLRKEDLQWLWLSQGETSAQAIDEPAKDYEIPKADVEVYFDLLGTRFQWKGRLDRFDGIGLDSKTRTIPCRVVVNEPRDVSQVGPVSKDAPPGPPALLRGMYVTLNIKTQPRVPLWRVPSDALRPGKILWIVRERKLVKREVRIAQTLEDEVIIHADGNPLSANDRIVISPLAYPHEGLEVREAAAR